MKRRSGLAITPIPDGSATLAREGVRNAEMLARMESMTVLKYAMTIIGDMTRGRRAFDPAAVHTALASITREAAALPDLFAPVAMDPNSEAKPRLWDEFDTFTARAEDLRAVSARFSGDRGAARSRHGRARDRRGLQGVPFGLPRMRRARRLAIAILSMLPGQVAAEHLLGGRDIAAGAALYADHCAACHGAELEGQPDWRSPGPDGILPAPPHDVTGHTWHHDSQLLIDYTRHGGQAALEARGVTGFDSGMPAFDGTLSEAEIRDILGFIRSTWPDEARRLQQERTHGSP